MKSMNVKTVWFVALLVFVSQISFAGLFADIGTYIKDRGEIRKHSNSIFSGVKEIYRERKSISSLTQASAQLIAAYKGISNKQANIPALLDIARNISTVVKEYQNLAPKCNAVYNRIEPDMAYFSKLKGTDGNYAIPIGSRQIPIQSLSESQIGKFAGTAGWSRVWDAVKENPLNVFRWGKLKDEYDYGKAEGTYVLKGIQLAFEAKSYYDAAKNSIDSLLGIQNQINGILNGDLGSLLGMGNTIDSIQSAAGGVQDLGAILNSAVDRVGTRFNELQSASQNYLTAHQNYVKKYGQGAQASTSSSGSGTSSGNIRPTTTQTTSNATAKQNLQRAMNLYQQAYNRYVAVAQNPNATPEERNSAIQDFNDAKREYERMKSAAGQ